MNGRVEGVNGKEGGRWKGLRDEEDRQGEEGRRKDTLNSDFGYPFQLHDECKKQFKT